MTVETTIQSMFDRYPDLFATRRDCYNHLFCVIGNGYEWRRGQIVRCDDEATIDEEAADYATTHTMARQTEENIRGHDERLQLLQKACQWRIPEFKWYPVSEYSLINSVPMDAKQDWRKAAKECIEMLMKDGIEL